jgi:uncharacterized protein (TIGR03083 family)
VSKGDLAEALGREAMRAGDFLAGLRPDEWNMPTRCPPMSVHDLASHVLRGAIRIAEMIEAGPVDEEPEADGETYFRYDPAQIGPDVVRRAQEAAGTFPTDDFVRTWHDRWKRSLDLAAVSPAEDRVYRNVFGGLMKLSEYLRTRAVELVVHHMDLRDALRLEPDPDPDALDAVCGVVAGLLGTDLRRLGVDAVRFALLGTGRAALSDEERGMLGPLADELPVIS